MTTAAVEDLDGQGLADALVANHATLLTAEARELVLAAAWADLHPTQALAPRPVLPGMERPRRFGGHGTPEAGEFAAAELAVLTGRSLTSASTLIADALDLRHRHPQLWAGLQAGQVRAWQARKIAARTRATGLTLTQATYVDHAATPYLGSLSWGRFLDLLEARIITADPTAAEARRTEAELDRFVTTGQSNDHGLKTLIAKATAGEIIYLVAVIDRIAEILLTHGDTSPVGVRRSKALGLLARPHQALTLLETRPAVSRRSLRSLLNHRNRWLRRAKRQRSPSRNHRTRAPEVSRRSLRSLLNHRMLLNYPGRCSTCTSPATALLTRVGVARMEDVGPITAGQAAEFLGHCHVTLKPVLDLESDMPVDAYEVPDRLRDQLRLRAPASVFPWSPSRSRRMDIDHTIPWRSTQAPRPPDDPQTRIGNLGFLTRSEHRIKTHAPGWQHRQPQPGTHTWRTPHGYHLTVDTTGTHRVSPPTADRSASAHERAFRQIVARQ